MENIFIKDQIINILSFAGHMVSVPTIELCQCSTRTAIDTMQNGSSCVPTELYL